MSETVIAAVIAGVVTILVCIINNVFQNKRLSSKIREEQKQSESLLDYKLTELSKKVQEHDKLVERMYHVEERTSISEEKNRTVNDRLEEVEYITGVQHKNERR